MPSLTAYIDKFKADVGKLAGRPMTQNHEGLSDFLSQGEETGIAKRFAESLVRGEKKENTSPLDGKYSMKCLQCAWNIADILSIAVRPPHGGEWSMCFFWGLIARNEDKEMYLYSLIQDIDYMNADGLGIVPHIVDETTYQLNLLFLSFIKDIKKTYNGRWILSSLADLSSIFLGKTIYLDQEIINTAENNIKNYEQYKQQQPVPIQVRLAAIKAAELDIEATTDNEMDDDDELMFYDALDEPIKTSPIAESEDNEGLIFYDALDELQLQSMGVLIKTGNLLHSENQINNPELTEPLSEIGQAIFVADPAEIDADKISSSANEIKPILENKVPKNCYDKICELLSYLCQLVRDFLDQYISNKSPTLL